MPFKFHKSIFPFIITLFSFFAFAAFQTAPTENTEASGFLILIQKTETGLKLQCETGCRWKDLTFSLKEDQSQWVDHTGMANNNENEIEAEDRADHFLFNIKKTSNGIELIGKHGTKWTRLTFSCSENECHQYIDESGMAVR